MPVPAIPAPWRLTVAPGPTGRIYYRAHHPRGWQRGAYTLESLHRLIAETPAGWPRGTVEALEQLRLFAEREAA